MELIKSLPKNYVIFGSIINTSNDTDKSYIIHISNKDIDEYMNILFELVKKSYIKVCQDIHSIQRKYEYMDYPILYRDQLVRFTVTELGNDYFKFVLVVNI